MNGSNKRRWLAPSAIPWNELDEDEITPAQAIVAESHRSAYDFRHAPFEGDATFFNSYERDSCPKCARMRISRAGFDSNGLQRYRCAACGKKFNSATGTLFEGRKLPLSAWVDFLLQAFSFESIAVITREDRRSTTTIPYWMDKVFAMFDGIQDDTVLSGHVQIDETYYPVPGSEAVVVDGKKLRGLSHNKICIGIGCDSEGRSYYVCEGFGKTSTAKTLEAIGEHIEPGSMLINDMEKGHRRLVADLCLVDEAYSSKLLSKLGDEANSLSDVNRLCFLLKLFLNSHSGFDRADLDGYLNLFCVMMNPPKDKMKKVALVLDRVMINPKTLQFREFYNISS